MGYVIQVVQHNRSLFKTTEGDLVYTPDALDLTAKFKTLFPKSEGYEVYLIDVSIIFETIETP